MIIYYFIQKFNFSLNVDVIWRKIFSKSKHWHTSALDQQAGNRTPSALGKFFASANFSSGEQSLILGLSRTRKNEKLIRRIPSRRAAAALYTRWLSPKSQTCRILFGNCDKKTQSIRERRATGRGIEKRWTGGVWEKRKSLIDRASRVRSCKAKVERSGDAGWLSLGNF